MKRLTITAAVAILIASFATVASAGDRGRGRGHHMKGDHGMRLFGQLDLTADQQAAIQKIRTETRADMQPLRNEVRDLRDEMREEWGTVAPDEQRILALHKQIHAIKGQMGVLRIEARVDTLNVLTPEQREQLATLKAERRAERAERRADGVKNRDGKKGKKGKKGDRGKRFGKRGAGFGYGMSVDPGLVGNSSF